MFNQGEEGTSWYIIQKGSVNVVIYGKVCVSAGMGALGSGKCNQQGTSENVVHCRLVLSTPGGAINV